MYKQNKIFSGLITAVFVISFYMAAFQPELNIERTAKMHTSVIIKTLRTAEKYIFIPYLAAFVDLENNNTVQKTAGEAVPVSKPAKKSMDLLILLGTVFNGVNKELFAVIMLIMSGIYLHRRREKTEVKTLYRVYSSLAELRYLMYLFLPGYTEKLIEVRNKNAGLGRNTMVRIDGKNPVLKTEVESAGFFSCIRVKVNPKSETLNSKQTRNTKLKTQNVLDFGFKILDLFRISDLEFGV